MRFFKYHAMGNDYVVLEGATEDESALKNLARRICDRHRGLGSDGILLRSAGEGGAKVGLRIFNPDGSEAEKSGNGLRIFARYLWDLKEVGEEFALWMRGGQVYCRVENGGRFVSAEMGQVSFDSRAIPVAGPPREVLNEPIEIGGEKLRFSAATIGNPHCVVLREHVNEAEARRLGPLLETDSRFPNRTNVQFMKVEDRKRLRVEIWERGAGYTLSSGTSSCAAAAVALRLGLCDRDVAVHVPGGVLRVCFDEHFGARLGGPVTRVADGNLSEEMLGA